MLAKAELELARQVLAQLDEIIRINRLRLVDVVVDVIQRNAHTGNPGDGKIFVCNVEEAVKISSGERGESAI